MKNKMYKYNLMTLNASELIKMNDMMRTDQDELAESPAFSFDFETITAVVLDQTDAHKDNAMFDQIIRCLCEHSSNPDINSAVSRMKENPDCLFKHILFLNFKDVFEEKTEKSGYDKQCRAIFKEGFSIKYEDGAVITYKPFDKSGSMARDKQKRMSFINDDIFEEMDRRIRMGIVKPDTMVIPSGYYSYRGMLFSDGNRIEENAATGFELNEKTVLVIEDDLYHINGEFLSAKNDEDTGVYEIVRKSKVVIVGFDGEGICSPEFATWLNEHLEGRNSASFQIRMPYAKGMLHCVNFRMILQEQLGIDDLSNVKIKDVFGIERSLEHIQVIMSESMFKCCKWLQKSKESDPMKHFFEQFHRYQYAMYVVKTDQSLSTDDQVKFNYQFLNTLAIPRKVLDKLVKKHINKACAIPKTGNSLRADLAGYLADMVYEDTPPSAQAWQYALSMNQSFVNDPYVKRRLEKIRDDRLCDIAEGDFTVDGVQLFLSDDLLRFIVHIIKHIEMDETIKGEVEERIIKQCISKDHFYTPLASTYGLKSGERYSLWRSPHLSRSEQCAPRAFIHKGGDMYSRYFSHLEGIIMLSHKSADALVLGGADYDGDLVKLIWEEGIVKGVLSGSYVRSGTDYVRRFPIVMIPKPEKKKLERAGSVDVYVLAQKTFLNRIGLISNMAIKIGLDIYGNMSDDERTDPCAECTMVTGMEIDAVKTGIKPDIDHIKERCSYKKPLFLDIREKISELKNAPFIPRVELSESGETEYKLLYKRKEIKAKLYSSDDNEPVLNYLPGYALYGLSEKDAKKRPDEPYTGGRIFFSFQANAEGEEDKNWIKRIKEEPNAAALLQKLSDLVVSYNDASKLASKDINKQKEADALAEKLRQKTWMLMLQSFPGENVSEMYDKTLGDLMGVLPNPSDVNSALDTMKQENWAFVDNDSRKDALYHILNTDGLSKEAQTVLLSNAPNAYQLLSFFLHIIKETVGDEVAENDLEEKGLESAYYADMLQMWEDISHLKPTVAMWKQNAIDYCREKMRELFRNDFNMALRYYCALLKKNDPARKFLWEAFRAEEILPNIYRDKEKEITIDAR